MKKNPVIQRLQDFFQINAGLMRLIQFVITYFVCVHLVGCLWYFSAKISNFGPDTWVVRYGI